MPTIDLTDEQVVSLVQQLPDDQKQRVLNVLSLLQQPGRRRRFGSAKGDILYMAPDFDEPLEDFKEYM